MRILYLWQRSENYQQKKGNYSWTITKQVCHWSHKLCIKSIFNQWTFTWIDIVHRFHNLPQTFSKKQSNKSKTVVYSKVAQKITLILVSILHCYSKEKILHGQENITSITIYSLHGTTNNMQSCSIIYMSGCCSRSEDSICIWISY
jgi:uncharacterized membrane-anchored protein YitT (DUF2179 family)